MIIVNFSTKQYLPGQQRLNRSLNSENNPGTFGYNRLMFTDYSQIGSPTHAQSPYEFKIWAIEKAFEHDDVVLWVDSSMYLVGDLSIIEKIIINEGYFMSEAGHYAGRWTNQHTRRYFKVTDEEMQQAPGGITMFSAGLTGLNKKSPIAMEFFTQWKASAQAGCFRGDWSDHRHDMTAGSIIASRLGMKYQRGGKHMSYIGPGYSAPEPNTVFHLQGL